MLYKAHEGFWQDSLDQYKNPTSVWETGFGEYRVYKQGGLYYWAFRDDKPVHCKNMDSGKKDAARDFAMRCDISLEWVPKWEVKKLLNLKHYDYHK